MLSALWFLGRKNVLAIIGVLSIASLFLAQYLSEKQQVNANFYLIFSRAWELFSGSLIALVGWKKISSLSTGVQEVLSGIGLVLILSSVFLFDKNTPFPSFYTLVPVIGTGLIIFFGGGSTLIGRILSHKLFVAVGLISYSLYLWHQPIFAFLRLKTIGEPDQGLFLVAISLTFVCAYISYRYVETPFRSKARFNTRSIFQLSFAVLVLFMAVGLSGHVADGHKNRFEDSQLLNTAQNSPKRSKCHTSGEDYLKPEDSCSYFGDNIDWAVFGDSHLTEPAFALSKMLEEKKSGCVASNL